MKVLAPAKINLCIDILKKSHSGYHEIATVIQPDYTFVDEVKISKAKEKDDVSISEGHQKSASFLHIKTHENLAYKALQLFKKTCKIKQFVKIEIKKNIPISSGLGGGSSDAAAVLKGLNRLWKLKLSKKALLSVAEKLGSDIPFFIIGKTALCTHFGEKIKPLKEIKCIKFKIDPIKKQTASQKTASMYAKLDLSKCGKNKEKTKNLIKGILKSDKKLIIENLHNDFETLIKLKRCHHLSGSGPATFKII